MADRSPRPDSIADTDADTGVGPDPEPRPGTPLWVKVFAIIALTAIVLFGIAMLTGGGGHGPGRHTGVDTPPSGLSEHRPSGGGLTP